MMGITVVVAFIVYLLIVAFMLKDGGSDEITVTVYDVTNPNG